jgi:hypothetical protein
MPTARLSAQFTARRAALFILGIAAVLALASFALTPETAACGGPPPRPLRTLYLESDRIVVAHIGETIPLETSFEDNYRKTSLKTTLYVTSTLKGEGDHYTVYIYHENWDWAGAAEQQGQENQHQFSEYKPDDTLLVFLIRRKEGKGYEVSDTTYAVKKLNDADLKIYTQRIEELAAIMQDEQPDNERLVEWLVRCVEEPATRWEGAYELVISSSALYDRGDADSNAEAQAETEANGESSGNTGGGDANVAGVGPAIISAADESSGEVIVVTSIEADAANDQSDAVSKLKSFSVTIEQPVEEKPVEEKIAARRFTLDSPDFIKLLTVEQKRRLADALFSVKDVSYNEMMLVELVKHWDEPRLVPFLLTYLHTVIEEPPYTVQDLVTLLAEKLDNQPLTNLAHSYCENAAYYDPEENSDANAAVQDAGDEAQQQQVDPEEKALRGTSTQKRSARLKRFLASADSLPAR